MATHCPFCEKPLQSDTSKCSGCNASHGYRDGKGVVRSRNAFIALGAMTILAAIALYWLAAQIPLWVYSYPLMGLAAIFALGTFIIAAMLIRGPKWYRA